VEAAAAADLARDRRIIDADARAEPVAVIAEQLSVRLLAVRGGGAAAVWLARTTEPVCVAHPHARDGVRGPRSTRALDGASGSSPAWSAAARAHHEASAPPSGCALPPAGPLPVRAAAARRRCRRRRSRRRRRPAP
jgi:hypothetical protein